MTGLDTNVVLRFVVQDDPVQAAIATKLFDSFSNQDPGFIPAIAVAEMAWVLHSRYDAKRNEISRVIETLLRSRELVVEQADLVWQALRQYARGNADFADCLIERSAHAAGCRHTITFDRSAAAGAGMKLLG